MWQCPLTGIFPQALPLIFSKVLKSLLILVLLKSESLLWSISSYKIWCTFNSPTSFPRAFLPVWHHASSWDTPETGVWALGLSPWSARPSSWNVLSSTIHIVSLFLYYHNHFIFLNILFKVCPYLFILFKIAKYSFGIFFSFIFFHCTYHHLTQYIFYWLIYLFIFHPNIYSYIPFHPGFNIFLLKLQLFISWWQPHFFVHLNFWDRSCYNGYSSGFQQESNRANPIMTYNVV